MTSEENPKPQGKVYQSFDIDGLLITTRDSAWVANHYHLGLDKLAEAATKVREAMELFAVAQSVTEDNGDPQMDAEQVLVKLAECMGSAWQYQREYLDEIPKEEA